MKLKVKKYRKWKRIDRWLQTAIIAMSIIIVGTFVTAQTISVLTLGRLQIGNNITVSSPAQLLLPDGTAAAPSLAPSSNPDLGIYFSAAAIRISLDNALNYSFEKTGLELIGSATYMRIGDAYLYWDASDTLALKNGNNDQHCRIYGANGTYRDEGTWSELLTIDAAASTDTAVISIPLDAVVYSVSVRVTTVIPTAATFTVTGATSGTVFNTAAVSTALNSTNVGTQNCPYKNGAAQAIRITPNLVPADNSGRVRITIHYYFINPATS